jgi:uncharacterized OB-fold protein
MQSALPQPEPNGDSRPYWDAAAQGRLVIRACKACGALHFMPRNQCPQCWSDRLEWVDSKGQGTVYSLSTLHRAPSPAFGANTPYVIAMVDLDEGPRMFANIVGEGALQAAIGERVEVVFEARGEGFKLPQFVRSATRSQP